MSLNQPLARLGPLFVNHGARLAPRRGRGPQQLIDLAVLVARRKLNTQTTSSQPSTYPPPGFNQAKAEKPVTSGSRQATASSERSNISKKEAVNLHNDVKVSAEKPSEHAPTKASAGLALTEMGSKQVTVENMGELGLEKKKETEKKLTLGQKIMREVHHYWDGTKLLATEVKISSKLALKMAAGYELSRREHRQLQRTVQDLGRLVPFSVFVIVPFAELLLPIALKLFPNMLPSTYEGKKSKEAKVASLRATRKEVSNFLRQTLTESGLPVTVATKHKEEFAAFFKKVCF